MKITFVLTVLCRGAVVRVGLREDYVFPIQVRAEKKHISYTIGKIKLIALFKQLIDELVRVII